MPGSRVLNLLIKIKYACQPDFMLKIVINFVSLIWEEIKISSDLVAENISLPQQLTVMQGTNKGVLHKY